MITFYRIACVQAGKMGPAMAFAHEIAGYVKDVFHSPIEIALPIGGNPNRIAWSVRYADMAAMEAMQEKMLRDAKYQQIVAKGADFLISGATRDSLWRGV
jgi:hypothetical protein